MLSNVPPVVLIVASPADSDWKERLAGQLQVYARLGALTIWEENRADFNVDLRTERQQAIQNAAVAIFLVSASFLGSDTILNDVVLPLLHRAREGKLRIVPVLVRPCDWEGIDWLRVLPFYPRDGRFVSSGSPHAIDGDFAAIVEDIRRTLGIGPQAPPQTTPEERAVSAVASPVDTTLELARIRAQMIYRCVVAAVVGGVLIAFFGSDGIVIAIGGMVIVLGAGNVKLVSVLKGGAGTATIKAPLVGGATTVTTAATTTTTAAITTSTVATIASATTLSAMVGGGAMVVVATATQEIVSMQGPQKTTTTQQAPKKAAQAIPSSGANSAGIEQSAPSDAGINDAADASDDASEDASDAMVDDGIDGVEIENAPVKKARDMPWENENVPAEKAEVIPSQDAGAPGFLRLSCNPFCDDVIDNGRSLGPSPIVDLAMKPGRHSIKLLKGTLSKTITIVVVSGQITREVVSMPVPPIKF